MTRISRKFGMAVIRWILLKYGYEITRKTPIGYPSETSKCRERLAKFCTGCGVDLGAGGDPITHSAIRVDLPEPYAHVGTYGVQLAGDAARLVWFEDEVLDYVYSSHLLEDFEDTEGALKEWLRVLKPKGRLVLFCPDEPTYRAHCTATGQPYNTNHKIPDFTLEKIKKILIQGEEKTRILHEVALIDEYSWELVVEKLARSIPPSGI